MWFVHRSRYFLWWFSFLLLAIGLFDLAERRRAEFTESQAATNEEASKASGLSRQVEVFCGF
jgi:hypothetical protein